MLFRSVVEGVVARWRVAVECGVDVVVDGVVGVGVGDENGGERVARGLDGWFLGGYVGGKVGGEDPVVEGMFPVWRGMVSGGEDGHGH